MRKPNSYIVILLILFSMPSQATDLSSHWYQLPEDSENNEYIELESFGTRIQDLVENQRESLEHIQDKTNRWYIDGINTSIGLGLSGNIGMLSWGGKKTIELFWHKREEEKSIPENKLNTQSIFVNEKMSNEDLIFEIEPLVNYFSTSGKVKDKSKLKKNLMQYAQKFLSVTEALSQTKTSGWTTSKLRLDLSISLEGAVTGIIIKAGGEMRVRFEWKRSIDKLSKLKLNLDSTQLKVKTLMDNFANEIHHAKLSQIEKYNYTLKYIRLGIVIGVKGNVGILKGAAAFAPYVYLTSIKEAKIYNCEREGVTQLFVSNLSEQHLEYALHAGLKHHKENKQSIFNISNLKLRKGIHKAVSFAAKTAKNISQKNKKDSRWGVKKIRSSFAFSIAGGIGAVTLAGAPSIELEFLNNNF